MWHSVLDIRLCIDSLICKIKTTLNIWNILFMAPRYGYVQYVVRYYFGAYLLKHMMFQPISFRSWSRTGVTYWPRFRLDNLVVDGGHMVSLVFMVGALYLILYGLLHLPLVPVGFSGQYFGVIHRHCHTVYPVTRQWSLAPIGLPRFVYSLNLWFHQCMYGCCHCHMLCCRWYLQGFFFGVLSLGCTTIKWRVLAGLFMVHVHIV